MRSAASPHGPPIPCPPAPRRVEDCFVLFRRAAARARSGPPARRRSKAKEQLERNQTGADKSARARRDLCQPRSRKAQRAEAAAARHRARWVADTLARRLGVAAAVHTCRARIVRASRAQTSGASLGASSNILQGGGRASARREATGRSLKAKRWRMPGQGAAAAYTQVGRCSCTALLVWRTRVPAAGSSGLFARDSSRAVRIPCAPVAMAALQCLLARSRGRRRT